MKEQALTWREYRNKRWLLGEFIKKACEHNEGTMSKADVEHSIRRGETIPIMFKQGPRITGIMTLRLEGDAVFVTTLAGSFSKGWADGVMNVLILIAKSQGRDKIRLRGRKGWTKFLKPLGFEQIENYLEAQI